MLPILYNFETETDGLFYIKKFNGDLYGFPEFEEGLFQEWADKISNNEETDLDYSGHKIKDIKIL